MLSILNRSLPNSNYSYTVHYSPYTQKRFFPKKCLQKKERKSYITARATRTTIRTAATTPKVLNRDTRGEKTVAKGPRRVQNSGKLGSFRLITWPCLSCFVKQRVLTIFKLVQYFLTKIVTNQYFSANFCQVMFFPRRVFHLGFIPLYRIIGPTFCFPNELQP